MQPIEQHIEKGQISLTGRGCDPLLREGIEKGPGEIAEQNAILRETIVILIFRV